MTNFTWTNGESSEMAEDKKRAGCRELSHQLISSTCSPRWPGHCLSHQCRSVATMSVTLKAPVKVGITPVTLVFRTGVSAVPREVASRVRARIPGHPHRARVQCRTIFRVVAHLPCPVPPPRLRCSPAPRATSPSTARTSGPLLGLGSLGRVD